MLKTVLNILILCSMFSMGILIGCASFTPVIKDSVLNPYVNSFAKDLNLVPDDLDGFTVKFETLGEADNGLGTQVIGYCNYYKSEITIDPGFWYTWGESRQRKKALVYHELAHCYCTLLHVDELREDGCPQSLMYSSLPTDSCLIKYMKEYIEEIDEECIR